MRNYTQERITALRQAVSTAGQSGVELYIPVGGKSLNLIDEFNHVLEWGDFYRNKASGTIQQSSGTAPAQARSRKTLAAAAAGSGKTSQRRTRSPRLQGQS